MAPNFQRGSTPQPGQTIKARTFGDLANATTATRTVFGAGQIGLLTAGGALTIPRIALPQRNSVPRPFFTYDVSAGGANGLISVTSGTITDLTNASTVWGTVSNPITMNDPVLGVVPFNIKAGSPLRFPYLQLNSAATCAYFNASVDSSTGAITAIEIDSDSGSGLPASTSINWYSLLTNLKVTITSGVATVSINNDGAQSVLYFIFCGLLPLTDGNSYRVGT